MAVCYDKAYLHPNDGVDEEEHGYQQDHIRQGLQKEHKNMPDLQSKQYTLKDWTKVQSKILIV